MDLEGLKKYAKPALWVGAGVAVLFVGYKLLSGNATAATGAADTTDPNAALAATNQANQLAANLQMASLSAQSQATQIAADAQVSSIGLQTFGQVAASAFQATAAQNTTAMQALSNAFVGNVAATATEVSAAATAAGTLGAANDSSVSQSIAAIGSVLAGAGALVGAATSAGNPMGLYNGLSPWGFSSLTNGTRLPSTTLGGSNSGVYTLQRVG